MPAYNRAEVTAEFIVVPSWEGAESPRAQSESARRAASESGLAHDSGPGSTILAGSRSEVLEALRNVIDAALDAGAHIVQIKVEAEGDAPRFQTS